MSYIFQKRSSQSICTICILMSKYEEQTYSAYIVQGTVLSTLHILNSLNPHDPTRWVLVLLYYLQSRELKYQVTYPRFCNQKTSQKSWVHTQVFMLLTTTLYNLFQFSKIIQVDFSFKSPYRDINLIYFQHPIILSISKFPELILKVCIFNTLKY